jgi:8-oxo-dGTP diphosphatase
MPVITVGAIVLRGERGQPRQVLLTKRRPDLADWAGLWGVPAGRLQENEEVEQALVRELAEEAGLLAREFEFLETVYAEEPASGRRYVHNLYLVSRWEGEAENRAPDEHETVAWVGAAEMASLLMPARLREILLALLGGPPAAHGEPVEP